MAILGKEAEQTEDWKENTTFVHPHSHRCDVDPFVNTYRLAKLLVKLSIWIKPAA